MRAGVYAPLEGDVTITELAPAGTIPGTTRTAAGADDQCSWEDWDDALKRWVRCKELATDTVRGCLYCSPHADKAAGI